MPDFLLNTLPKIILSAVIGAILIAILVTTSLITTSISTSQAVESAEVQKAPITVKPQFITDPVTKSGRYIMNIMVHDAKEMDALLTRAKQLSTSMRKIKNHTRISLVLHGDEVTFFQKKNYKKYKQIVDKAAELDAKGVIDIKMCKTKMNLVGIKENEIPAYIEIVPYGPDEEKALIKKGYIYM